MLICLDAAVVIRPLRAHPVPLAEARSVLDLYATLSNKKRRWLTIVDFLSRTARVRAQYRPLAQPEPVSNQSLSFNRNDSILAAILGSTDGGAARHEGQQAQAGADHGVDRRRRRVRQRIRQLAVFARRRREGGERLCARQSEWRRGRSLRDAQDELDSRHERVRRQQVAVFDLCREILWCCCCTHPSILEGRRERLRCRVLRRAPGEEDQARLERQERSVSGACCSRVQ